MINDGVDKYMREQDRYLSSQVSSVRAHTNALSDDVV